MPVCPNCGSGRSNAIQADGSRVQFTNDRRCKDCLCRWSPGCPKWAAVFAVICGVLVAGLIIPIGMLGGALFGLLFGGAAIATSFKFIHFGVNVLKGKSGQPEIIAAMSPRRGGTP